MVVKPLKVIIIEDELSITDKKGKTQDLYGVFKLDANKVRYVKDKKTGEKIPLNYFARYKVVEVTQGVNYSNLKKVEKNHSWDIKFYFHADNVLEEYPFYSKGETLLIDKPALHRKKYKSLSGNTYYDIYIGCKYEDIKKVVKKGELLSDNSN